MNFKKSLFYLFLPIVGGGIIGLVINGNIDYTSLARPPLSPPSIVFPIVWSFLYFLIGLAYWFYRKENADDTTIILYYAQLFFNFLWSVLFFVFRWRTFSAIWIIFLAILIILLMIRFYKEERVSVYLVIPYILWVLFAVYLNIGVALLN